MRFAANLSMLFPDECSWDERCRRAAALGFTEVEILFPYTQSADQLRNLLQYYGLELVLINTPITTERHGLAALPTQNANFIADFQQALSYSQQLGVQAVHVMAGSLDCPQWNWQEQLINNLSKALELISTHQPVRIQLEALNRRDMPHYAYADPRLLVPVLEHFSGEAVGLQFDFYHTLRQGYDLLALLKELRPYISHVQIADPINRGAPNFKRHPQLLKGLHYLAQTDYKGSIGLEYRPVGPLEDSLAFLQAVPNAWRPSNHCT